MTTHYFRTPASCHITIKRHKSRRTLLTVHITAAIAATEFTASRLTAKGNEDGYSTAYIHRIVWAPPDPLRPIDQGHQAFKKKTGRRNIGR